MPNPWDMNSPLARRIASVGKHALETGKVSPEEAHANLLAMTNPQASSPLDMNAYGGMGDQPYGPSSSYAPQTPAQAPMGPAERMYKENNMSSVAGTLGAGLDARQQDTNTYKRSATRYTQYTPDEIRAMRLQAQGQYPEVVDHEQATDADGNPVYEQRGVDAQGNPVYAYDKPVKDMDRPKYNFDHVTVDENDPVRQQQQGLNRMEDLLGLEAQANRERPTMDYTPISALADAENARHGVQTNLAASSVRPQDPTGKFMAYADEIQKRRADIQKAIVDGVKAQKSGSTMDLLAASMLNRADAKQATPVNNPALNQQDRRAYDAYKTLQKTVNNDSVLQTHILASGGLGKALGILANEKNLTPQQINSAQQEMIAAIRKGTGSTSIGDERVQDYFKELGWNADNLRQFLTGDPAEISHNSKLVQSIKKQAVIEQQTLGTLFNRRLDALTGGLDSSIFMNPRYNKAVAAQQGRPELAIADYLSDLQGKRDAAMAQVSDVGGTPIRGGAKATAAGIRKSAPKGTPAPRAAGAPPSGGLPSLDDIDAEIAKRKGGK